MPITPIASNTSMVSVQELTKMRPNPDAVYPHHLVGVIKTLVPLREREFHSGKIISFIVEDRFGDSVRVCAFGEWADALVFAVVGDELKISNFRLLATPGDPLTTKAPPTQSPPKRLDDPNPTTEYLSFFLAPHPTDSTVVVAQAAEQNDVIEFLVTPEDFENPTAKVRKNMIGENSPAKRVLVNDIPGSRTVHE